MARVRSLLSDHRVRLLILAAAAVGVYAIIAALVPDVQPQELLEDVARTLGRWTYLVVAAFAFLETGAFVGLVVPGETVVILGGAVAGVGETKLWLTIALVWFFAWAGDSTSFLLGRHLGRGWVLRHGHRLRVTRERFASVEQYFERHGGKTILAGRFIGVVRALAPFIAGSSGMRYGTFLPFSIVGTGLWGAGFTVLGYLASRSLDEATDIAGQVTFLFGVAVALVVLAIILVRRVRKNARGA